MIHIEMLDCGPSTNAMFVAKCDACEIAGPICLQPGDVAAWVRGHLSTAHWRGRHEPRRTRAGAE